MTVPLIYTSKGNLPIADLEYGVQWELGDDFIKLVETYRLAVEVVRQSAHVYDKRGIAAGAIAGELNG